MEEMTPLVSFTPIVSTLSRFLDIHQADGLVISQRESFKFNYPLPSSYKIESSD